MGDKINAIFGIAPDKKQKLAQMGQKERVDTRKSGLLKMYTFLAGTTSQTLLYPVRQDTDTSPQKPLTNKN